ncbi:MAG: ZIP family metal transporter [Pirellulaceae bacterium]
MVLSWLATHWLIVLYSVLILLASLAGGMLPLMVRLTHATTQFAVSFVAGVMLGVGFLHMLPHAAVELGVRPAMAWVLGGFLLMFFIQRYLAVHQHVAPHEQTAHEHRCGESDEVHHHAHEDIHPPGPSVLLTPQGSWTGAALGLSLHSLLNGVALAAAFESQRKNLWWAGGAAFIAVFVHKPFDSLTITTLMAAGGRSRRWCHAINILFSLVIPLGVAIFYLGLGSLREQSTVLGCSLGISAGVFLCIAASDLLPEMHFHSHDRGALSLWLLTGVGLAFLLENLSP